MDPKNDETREQVSAPEEEHYVERPAWQVWGARAALVLFLLFLAMYYLNIFGGKA